MVGEVGLVYGLGPTLVLLFLFFHLNPELFQILIIIIQPHLMIPASFTKTHFTHHQSTATPCEPGCSFLEKIPPLTDLEMQEIDWDSPPSKTLFQEIIDELDNKRLSPKSSHSSATMEVEEPFFTVSVHGCKCSKIGCLKLYCECFTRGQVCGPNCVCVSCENCLGNQHKIHFAQQMANFRKPGTFQGVKPFVPERKCNCKKSKCQKKYCECFNAGLKCTEHCDCIGCQNHDCEDHHDHGQKQANLRQLGPFRMEIEIKA